MLKYLFSLDGEWTDEYGITLQGPVGFSSRIPKVETISIPGRNGDLHIYQGGFENVTGRAKCYVLKHYAYEQLSMVSSWLLKSKGYRRLEVSGEPGRFRLARIVKGPEEAIRMGLMAPFELEFDCDPRVFLKEGEQPLSAENGGYIYNPYMEATPLVELTGSGEGTFTIGSVTVAISEMNDSLILDCDTQNAYKGIENKNSTISAMKFPVLEPGNNLISWTGGITGATIIPRWWV